MELKATDTQAKLYRVYFNGKPATQVLSANDIEGWVEVLDVSFIGMIAPITKDSANVSDVFLNEVDEFKTKKLYGKVEIKMIPLPVKNKY